MKHLHKSLMAICLTFALFSCSKKVQTFRFGQPYYQENSAKAVQPNPTNIQQEESMHASSAQQHQIEPTATEAIVVAKSIKESNNAVKIEPTENKPVEKLSLKEKVTKKINKKIQKQMGRSGVSGNLRTGIIIAAIGLLLLIIAGVGGFGGASGVFWVLGAVALVIGLVIVLLEVI